MPIMFSGVYSDGTKVDPLSFYQRSRLGRWKIEKDVDGDDAVFGIQLETPARTIRIRCEAIINGKSFRESREKTIDDFMAISRGEKVEVADEAVEVNEKETAVKDDPAVEESEATEESEAEAKEQTEAVEEETEEEETEEAEAEEEETEAKTGAEAKAETEEESDEEEGEDEAEKETPAPKFYVASSSKDRLATYARARGDQLTRHELRRRVADISGGPALLRTADGFGTHRHKTMTLFAFLDTNQNGVISQLESDAALKALAACDLNSNDKIELEELQKDLKSNSAQRKISSTGIGWQPWDAIESHDVEDLSLQVSFNDDSDDSSLKISDVRLDESWELTKIDVLKDNPKEPYSTSAMLSHPKVSVVLSAAQPEGEVEEEFNQISIGVTLEGNALFRALDQDGDWSLSKSERRSCSDVIASLDTNSNGLEAGELPILLRLCVARGATAHQALNERVAIVPQSDRANKEKQKLSAPEWFTSMDKDGDLILTREEFIGPRKSFNKIDTNKNKLLSVEEVLEFKPGSDP